MTHPYRTAPLVAPQRPWWRRALCAVGRHSLYLVIVNDQPVTAECEHCGRHEDPRGMAVIDYLKALMHDRTTHTRTTR